MQRDYVIKRIDFWISFLIHYADAQAQHKLNNMNKHKRNDWLKANFPEVYKEMTSGR